MRKQGLTFFVAAFFLISSLEVWAANPGMSGTDRARLQHELELQRQQKTQGASIYRKQIEELKIKYATNARDIKEVYRLLKQAEGDYKGAVSRFNRLQSEAETISLKDSSLGKKYGPDSENSAEHKAEFDQLGQQLDLIYNQLKQLEKIQAASHANMAKFQSEYTRLQRLEDWLKKQIQDQQNRLTQFLALP